MALQGMHFREDEPNSSLGELDAREQANEQGHEHEGHDHDHCDCGCEGHNHEHHHGHGHLHKQGHEHEGHDHDHCDCGCEGHNHHHGHEGHDHHHHHEEFKTRELSAEPTFSCTVLDLDCPNCARTVENAVRALKEVEDARLVYATATLEVVASSGVDLVDCKRAVVKAVRSCGENIELSEEEEAELDTKRGWYAENREKILMSISAFALVAGLLVEQMLRDEVRAIPYYIVASLAGLVFIAPMAFAALRRRTADMNVLMGIAVIGALVIGSTGGDPEVFRDAAIVIFLDQVGEWLEGWSMRKTSGSIRELMQLAPSIAHVISPDGTTEDVETASVEEGWSIRILPGERVPLDGIITCGSSSFNEAPVTGESVPQDKSEGAEIFAGSLNTTGVVDVLVTADEDCTTLARIVSEVQGAQAEKAPYESFVDRFAAAYTPIVIAGAIVLGVIVPVILSIARGGVDLAMWQRWAYRACSLLVVACPCALVISTPVSFVSALSRAARMGVLVKGGAYFDLATHVHTIAFDKTGTLTTGNPSVCEVVPFGSASAADVIAVAAALEESSTHPLAKAVVDEASRTQAPRTQAPHLTAEGVEEIPACGMRGRVAGEMCTAGKLAYAQENAKVGSDVEEAVKRMGDSGATAIVVTRAAQVLGVIAIADTVREEASDAIAALSREGIECEMLTGDNSSVAAAVARELGIDCVSAELLPGHKMDRIDALQREGSERADKNTAVAMVGDGINDAPALAKADIGITMGAAASDTALEVADVALLSNNLEQLPEFFGLAHRAMNIVRENITFAIAVKLIVFVLVTLGLAGMGAAVFADTGVALIVVLNGMRLMRASRLRW
ncbi:MAG: cation-translocating P-type ATPase [Atopobiaceae bacterium]|nr:cation-translocating P-type ATPase [Atopobiaceae bacterium]